MTRKQHKRGNISKQHKSRENSCETSNKVPYKSDTKREHFYTLKWYSGDAAQWQRGGVVK